VSGGLTTVDMQRFAGDERGLFEVENSLDHIADLTQPAEGVKADHALVGRGVMVRSLDDSQGDRLTRTPRDAYSVASERVTTASPPLVCAASADGVVLLAWSTRLVVTLTTWPLPWLTIRRMVS
jgi:hypothetical protein